MSHPVNWFQIQGPNGHALQQFYSSVFGWKMLPSPGNSGDTKMVSPEKPDGIPGNVGTSKNHQPSVAVYVSVADIDAHFGKIQRAGGRMAMPKTKLPAGMGTVAGFIDPAGNWIGLWSPEKKARASNGAKRRATSTSVKKRAASKNGARRITPKRVTKKVAASKRR